MNAEGQVAWTECVRRAMNMARIESKANSTVGLFAVGIPAADAELRALRQRVVTLEAVAKAAKDYRKALGDEVHAYFCEREADALDDALTAAGFGTTEASEGDGNG